MAKKTNRGASGRRTGKRSAPLTTGMKLFAVGCAAELYVFILRRCYINGSMSQVVAWYDALPWAGLVGLALCAAGAAWTWAVRKNPVWRVNAGCTALLGAFLALASFAAHWNQSSVNLLSVLVPAAMLLCVFWSLYDRACALSLTILSLSLLAAWLCYRTSYQFSPYRLPVKALVVLALAVLAVGASMLRARKIKPLRGTDPVPVYLACVLAAVGMLISLIGPQAAWYAMWGLALAGFGLVVYYTVRQL